MLSSRAAAFSVSALLSKDADKNSNREEMEPFCSQREKCDGNLKDEKRQTHEVAPSSDVRLFGRRLDFHPYANPVLGDAKTHVRFLQQEKGNILHSRNTTDLTGGTASGKADKFCELINEDSEDNDVGPVVEVDGVSAQLLQFGLWQKFYQNDTEMIITKTGRRMFPVIKTRLKGLDPKCLYLIYLDMALIDSRKYRYVYSSSRWVASICGGGFRDQAPYIYPDSPMAGEESLLISFDKVKLTNNRCGVNNGQKYLPRIWIQKVNPQDIPSDSSPQRVHRGSSHQCHLGSLIDRSRATLLQFPETAFVTVTAYQNQQVLDIKPFVRENQSMVLPSEGVNVYIWLEQESPKRVYTTLSFLVLLTIFVILL